jgi:serpin B
MKIDYVKYTITCFLIAFAKKALGLELTGGQHAFADNLVEQLYNNENECSSAWGISMALSLIYPISDGETETQLATVLGYPSSSESKLTLLWNETASRLDSAFEGECMGMMFQDECGAQQPTLKITNGIWVNDGDTLNPVYTEIIGDSLRQIDFLAPEAADILNAWVDVSTEGLIKEIVSPDSLTSLVVLVAINTIYLRASWDVPFDEYETSEELFYTSASHGTALETMAQLMYTRNYFKYSEDALSNSKTIQLPFAESSLSMIIVLPRSEPATTITSGDVVGALPNLTMANVDLTLPKFKFESTYDTELKSSLESLGLVAPFVRGLCVYENICDGYIDAIIQKTVIDVNEKGVEAAAAAVVMVGRTSFDEPVEFLADHPFQFFIYDETEDIVLFEGRVGSPQYEASNPLDLTPDGSNKTSVPSTTPSFLPSSIPSAAPSAEPSLAPSTSSMPILVPSPFTTLAEVRSASSSRRTHPKCLIPSLLALLLVRLFI